MYVYASDLGVTVLFMGIGNMYVCIYVFTNPSARAKCDTS